MEDVAGLYNQNAVELEVNGLVLVCSEVTVGMVGVDVIFFVLAICTAAAAVAIACGVAVPYRIQGEACIE